MLIHLGRGVAAHSEDVITLTDLQRPLPQDSEALLEGMRRKGLVRTLGPEPKTMVLLRQGRRGKGKIVCYLSCVGLRTLRLRMEEAQGLLVPRPLAEDLSEVQHG